MAHRVHILSSVLWLDSALLHTMFTLLSSALWLGSALWHTMLTLLSSAPCGWTVHCGTPNWEETKTPKRGQRPRESTTALYHKEKHKEIQGIMKPRTDWKRSSHL